MPVRPFDQDLNGSLTLDQVVGGVPVTYEWDSNDYLVAINRGAERTEMSYDGLGCRIRIRELAGGLPQSDRRYLWCGDVICAQLDGATGTPTRLFLAEGETDPLGVAKWYYVRDHLGSVRYVTDSTAEVQASFDYDPWGHAARLTGTEDPTFGYAGYFTHRPTGLDLTWFRAYDPTIGRWLSRDPIGEAGGVNLYAYAANSPLTLVDWLGLDVKYCKGPSDLPLRGLGFPHGWIKTTRHEAGQQSNNYTMIFDTVIKSEDGRSLGPGANCETVPNTDEECVERHIIPFTPAGTWTPFHTCHNVVLEILGECRVGPFPQPPDRDPPPVPSIGARVPQW